MGESEHRPGRSVARITLHRFFQARSDLRILFVREGLAVRQGALNAVVGEQRIGTILLQLLGSVAHDDAVVLGQSADDRLLGYALVAGGRGWLLGEAFHRAGAASLLAKCARQVTCDSARRTTNNQTSAQAAKDADLIVVAVPVGACGTVAKDIAGSLKPGAILSDVGSVKGAVIADIAPRVQAPVSRPIHASHTQRATRRAYATFSCRTAGCGPTTPSFFPTRTRRRSSVPSIVLARWHRSTPRARSCWSYTSVGTVTTTHSA